MKSMMLYLVVLVGGAAVGAFGVGAYNVMTGEAVEDVAGVDDGLEDEGGGESVDESGEDGPSGVAVDGTVASGAESGEDTGAGVDEPGVELGGQTASADAGEPDGVDEAAGVDGPAGPATSVATPSTPVVQLPPPDPDSLARLAENYQRLARIFSAMKPDEAAPVLAQLDDEQLEGILLAMQGRNAAPILAELDPERAAALSRKVLRGNE